MRTLFVAFVVTAFGCDDSEVIAKAADVLEYGSVAARVECDGDFDGPLGNDVPFRYSAHRLVDGAVFARVTGGLFAADFWSRDQAKAASASVSYLVSGTISGGRWIEFTAEGGDLTVFCAACTGPSDTPDVIDISTSCTGFNLAAFE